MDEKEKPFDTISIVILLTLALVNDGAEIFFDLLAATVVGLPGEAIMEPIDLAMDGIFTFWFFAKCGMGGPSIIQLVDDLLELVGIPGRTICAIAGILIANNPKLAAVAEMAGAAAATGGAGAVAAEAGETAEVGAVAAEGAATAGEGAAATTEAAEGATSVEGAGEGPKEAGAGERGETQKKEAGEELEKEMETEEEKPPEEVEGEKLFEQTPQAQGEEEDEEEEVEEPSQAQAPISIEDIKRRQVTEDVKKNLQHPRAPRDITEENSDQDEDLPIAA